MELLDRLEGLVSRYEEVSTLITDPAVIADQKRYVKLTKEYKDLGRIVEARKEYVGLLQNIEDAKEMMAAEEDAETKDMLRQELNESEARIPELEEEIKLLLIPADPEDDKNVIMEIRGGTGGDEAALFAGDLFRMYSKYIETKGWKMAVSSYSEGAVGGYKEIIFSVTGEGVYGILKYESGVHRVQRVPATETQGRVHTSAATVAVLPEAEAFDVEINEGAIKWDTFRSSGAGGQNLNKVESGVRARYMWHNPFTNEDEEILVECTETRDQPKNKERALARLRTFIYDKEHQKYIDDIASKRKTMVSTGDRSAKIRTYNYPQGRITDHLCAHQDIRLSLLKLTQYLFVTLSAACRVEVHACYPGLWEDFAYLVFDAFRAETYGLYLLIFTVGAAAWDGVRITTIVTRHLVQSLVKGQTHVTMRTAWYPSTGMTLYGRRVATSVLEEYDLFTILQRLVHFLQKNRSKGTRHHLLAAFFSDVDYLYVRQGDLLVAFEEFHKAVFPRLAVVVSFKRRSGRSEQCLRPRRMCYHEGHVPAMVAWGWVLLFEARLMLLIHDDQSQVLARKEHRRAHPYDDVVGRGG